ncbi:uncharacterized protein LOC118414259 [Branchiostoma floridae]|uniref:Uncharacterized protein LOC118414259 n=1 Tax=Branchiostoma floridae TaxID=7739 RepID=A0A9J7MN27_BRAFL|nr:uncharacterized protein LOC118414259 [Branchiostoma floridae]
MYSEMSRILAVLLAVLVTTAATANLPSPHRLARRSAPSEDEVRMQRRANLLALLEDDDNETREPSEAQGAGLSKEEAEALVKYLQEPVGGLRRPAVNVYRPDVEEVEREKKTTRLLSWAAEMLRMMSTKGGFQFRFGKREAAEGKER